MKLAEALILRADRQKRIEQLKQRLIRNAKFQEGERPAEAPEKLTEELEQIAAELERLIQRINHTNSVTKFGSGTLADALATRDVLMLKQSLYRELAQAATVTQDRFSKSEVKFKSAVNVADVQKRADDLSKAHRELDTRIQEINWLTELME